uniref:Uncharacterized protein n=1 Tax=Phenylobacterium glaciei TaxID=2803784 RepID=A0A974S9D3_9CAUL|nr:hypothetical protein JKL49_09905 [Phenylobacterium glaciei]
MISASPQVARRSPWALAEPRRSWVAGTSPAMTIKSGVALAKDMQLRGTP